MSTEERGRGVFFICLSVLMVSVGLHLTRAALENATPLIVSSIHISTACFFFFFMGWFWRIAGWRAMEIEKINWSSLSCFVRANRGLLSVSAWAIALSGWLMNASIGIYGAEMTAFLANLAFVFLVLAGWAAGEKVRPLEAAVITAMIVGAFLFSYHGGRLAWGAIGLMSVVCAVTAAKQLIVKNFSACFPLPVVMCAVMLLSLPWTVLFLFLAGQWELPGLRSVFLAALSGFLTSVAGMTLLYRAYHMIGVALGAPFNTLRPLVVLLIGLAFGHAMPGARQLAGGMMILAGSFTLALQKNG